MTLRRTMLTLATLIAVVGTAPVCADTLSCPDLSTVVQVGACPSEDDLAYTFTGYCSDNARLYDRDGTNVCTDFNLYREFKNIALWETRDGKFDGYVSCSPGKNKVTVATPKEIKISQQGTITRIACRYDNGYIFTHRTKAKCQADAARCTADPAACKATCE